MKLKLVGIKTFIAAFTMGVVMQKGQTCAVDDSVGKKLMASERTNKEGESIAYWSEVNDDEVDFNFMTSKTVTPPASAEVEKPVENVVVKTKPIVTRQRKPATA